jgi:molybdopterin-guanine dinucleotide biosynthesis protein
LAIIVVGGHARNIGKTSVVAGLIRALPEFRWSAFKITHHWHGTDLVDAKEVAAFAISEECPGAAGTDSSRYLEAGALRSFWVRTREGRLGEAMPRLREEFARAQAGGGNVLVESNSILGFVEPDVYLSVLDPSTADFKESALRYLDRADAVLLAAEEIGSALWKGVSLELLAGKPRFQMQPPEYVTAEIAGFVRDRLEQVEARREGGD